MERGREGHRFPRCLSGLIRFPLSPLLEDLKVAQN